MQFLASLLTNLAYLNPMPLSGWLVWLGFAGLLGVALFNWRAYQPKLDSRAWGILGALAFLTLITTFFLGVEFSSGSALPVPGLPEKPPGSTMMIFSAIPWTLAGGLLGPFAGAGLGLLSGLIRTMWDTHSLFTAGEIWLMGGRVSGGNLQGIRQPFFEGAGRPLAAA